MDPGGWARISPTPQPVTYTMYDVFARECLCVVKWPSVLCNAEGRRFSFCIGVLSTSLGIKMSSLYEMMVVATVKFFKWFYWMH